MNRAQWVEIEGRLTSALKLKARPIAITFLDDDAQSLEIPLLSDPAPAPSDDGRTGRVAAGCVFWIRATSETFRTVAADHANCSVGSLTHGFLSLHDAASRGDVELLLESGWINAEQIPTIPVVERPPAAVVYGPIGESGVEPDVILIRLHAAALMVLADAVPDLMIEGKPQCHIVAIAKEQGRVAASLGCALSRARTGMRSTEMTCAIPARMAVEIADRVTGARSVSGVVAHYASKDARRFAATKVKP